MIKLFAKVDWLIEKLSSIFLVIALFCILYLSLQGIVLRWFQTSIIGVEPLIRHLVFLSAFFGGVIATGRKGHISIDLVAKYVESKHQMGLKRFVERVIHFVCLFVLLWLIYASFNFLKIEREHGKIEFFGIHSSYLVGIIPFGLSLMAYRFFYLLLVSIFSICDNRVKE